MKLGSLFGSRDKTYIEYLQEISGIKFTVREIDIISCILYNKNEKRIATILDIAPKTVEAHTRNIMNKIGCNSKSHIISFIAKSQKLEFFQQYYSILLVRDIFKKYIREIVSPNALIIKCIINNVDRSNKKLTSCLEQLQNDLKLANVSLEINEETNVNNLHTNIYVLTNANERIPDGSIGIIINNQDNLKTLEIKTNLVDFSSNQNYYFSFFELLQKITNNSQIANIKEKFQKEYETIVTNISNINIYISERPDHIKGSQNNILPLKKETKLKSIILSSIKSKFTLVTFTILFILGIALHIITSNTNIITTMHSSKSSIRSDLVIPNEKVLLERPDIIKKMDGLLTDRKGNIKTLALTGIIGIGGAGKTTIARYYGKFISEAKVVWELNSERKESLINSFQDLAYALATNKNKQEDLEHVINTQNPVQKEKKLLLLLKTWLKEEQNWLLIFDNVENIMDIKEFFPQDPNVWGNGKVIITTRNNNIQNTECLTQSDIIQVDELNNEQKLTLFSKIFYNKLPDKLTSNEKQQAENFLNHIPPFPLDVSSAAYYLQSTNTPFDNYLKNLEKSSTEFENAQENLLKEKGPYTKTRYNIITKSLEHLIEVGKEFKELMLFISLLDSQNIPRTLLANQKNEIILDNFISTLKKYSFITNETPSAIGPMFSIHRSTQAIMLSYFKQKLNLENNKELVVQVATSLENYMNELLDREDYINSRILLGHFETFFTHDMLSDYTKGAIGAALAGIYCNFERYDQKTEQLLKNSIKLLENQIEKDIKPDGINVEDVYIKIARAKTHLGAMYTILGYYDKANHCLNDSLKIYEKYEPHHIRVGMTLRYLGLLNLNTGNYKKARYYLEQSIEIYQKYSDDLNVAFSQIYLGTVYTELGDYNKAKCVLKQGIDTFTKNYSENDMAVTWGLSRIATINSILGKYDEAKNTLEHSLVEYNKYYGTKNHPNVAWIMVRLGNTYTKLKDYEKAKKILEDSLSSNKSNCSNEQVDLGVNLLYLGKLYNAIGDYKKAEEYIQQSISIYKKVYGNNHIQIALALSTLGENYLLKSEKLELTENLLNKAKEVLNKENHPEIIVPLELLGDLYSKKAELAKNNNNAKQFEDLKSESINYYKQALNIGEKYLPKDSAHISRINSKITNVVRNNL